MSRLSTKTLAVVSDTELITRSGIWDEHGMGVHQALLDWCKIHGLDPYEMPADNRIVRDVERCRVEYDVIVRDSDGLRLRDDDQFVVRRVHVQGETPPMPFPDVIARPLGKRLGDGPPRPPRPAPLPNPVERTVRRKRR